MSGGHFDYQQYRIEDIATEIHEIIARNNDDTPNGWGGTIGRFYSFETLAKFAEAVTALRRAAKMAQRIDWLLSGDDAEESFHERWEEEIGD